MFNTSTHAASGEHHPVVFTFHAPSLFPATGTVPATTPRAARVGRVSGDSVCPCSPVCLVV